MNHIRRTRSNYWHSLVQGNWPLPYVSGLSETPANGGMVNSPNALNSDTMVVGW